MNLQNVPALRVEDFPTDQQGWLNKLFIQLTPFFTSLQQVLSQNIDYATNFKSVTQSYNVKNVQAFSLAWNYVNSPPQDVRVISAYKGQDMTPCVLVAPWSFNASNKSITINNMYEVSVAGNIAATGQYAFTVRATI